MSLDHKSSNQNQCGNVKKSSEGDIAIPHVRNWNVKAMCGLVLSSTLCVNDKFWL